ncbi:SsrA-binding protein [uncultured Desulfobacterium sp.]|uniref:SsrA-binding protein n=1 Tax=uncultured Desulfobacterium sp. TaxID=201089 RepID=A0A445MXH8_9BACT|nr:SsrA-binding protein [uncultured Desulfobacterium sp.]
METKTVCQNKKARYDYFIDEVIEAGIVLLGPEVKSLRDGRASLVDSYARVKKGEVFIHNMNISPYPFAHHIQLEPMRVRKLLLNKKEIKRLIGKTEEKGFTLIPTRVYFAKNGKAKVELALAKGKKQYDKRHVLKEKDIKREMEEGRKRNQQ